MILFSNIQSLSNKIADLQAFVAHTNPEIICINETFLTDRLDNACLDLPEYIVFRDDRLGRSGGGVLMAIKKHLNPIKLDFPSTFEALSVKISYRNSPIVIYTAYRPPSANVHDTEEFVESLSNSVSEVNNFIFLGDMNFPDINWSTLSSPNSVDRKFLNFVSENELTQYVLAPTRGNNLLDIALSTPGIVANASIHPPIGTSDHDTVLMRIEYHTAQEPPKTVFNWKNTPWDLVHTYLAAINWDELFNNCNIEQMWLRFSNILQFILDSFVPKSISKPKKSAPWFDANLKRLTRKKQRLHRKVKRAPTNRNKRDFRNISNYLKSQIQFTKKHYERTKFSNKNTNPKSFFNYISDRTKTKDSVQPLHCNNSQAISSQEKSNVLAEQFKSVYITDDGQIPHYDQKIAQNSLTDITISHNDVYQAIKNLKTHSSPGPDKIPPKFIKQIACHITAPLTIIFKKSVAQGCIPESWKCAEIIPVYKKNRRPNSPASYRPVALTSICCKLLERIIMKKLYNYFSNNNLFCTDQHGFIKGKSTLTNLISTTNDINNLLDRRKTNVDIIYLDLAKAFDTVSHCKVIAKLRQYGIGGNVLNWINHFLTNRKQYVKVNEATSEVFVPSSGVPQGACLSSLLFLVYVNDVCDVISHSTIKLFADDAKLYREVSSVEDANLLQRDLNAIASYFAKWQLKINSEKSNVIHLGNSSLNVNYSLNNEVVQSVDEVKDLGFTMSSNYSVGKYISKISANALYKTKLMSLAFSCKDTDFKLFLFTTYIRPIVEYITPVWNPHLVCDIDAVERVQRRFTKFLPGLSQLPYIDRLEALNLKSLEERRLNFDLILLFKIINNLIPLNPNDFFEFANLPTRGHNLKIRVKYSRTNIKKYAFPNRIIHCWNDLPSEVVNAQNINQFKSKLKLINLRSYCKGSTTRL